MESQESLQFSGTSILEVAVQSAYSYLMAASKSDNFLPTIAPVFNGSADLSSLQALSESWILGDFSQLPTIEILSSNLMNGANGAFSEVTRTIYLSSDYLVQGSSNPDLLTGATGVLLEEIGHFVDTLINPGSDTPGDEGALFAATLMGLPLSNAEKLLIHQEDDHSFVTIDNQAIAVEQSDDIDPRELADLLWDTGATVSQIGVNLKNHGFDLPTITDALNDGVTKSDGTKLNYTDVAIGLWNSGHSIDTRVLADLLWDEGATETEIAQALNYGIGRNLAEIASDMKYGVTKSDGTALNYTSVAVGLWNSGHSIDARKLADLLWDEGASQQQIGQAMNYLGLSLETIADSVKRGITKSDGTGLNDIDVAIALWNSGYSVDTRKLADLLWDQGANPIEIGQAMKYLGLSLETIADSVKWGITKADGTNLDYHQVAEALWNSGYTGAEGFNSRKLADLLWDEGASQQQIGQAFNYLGLSLETIADAMDDGVTNDGGSDLNYIDVSLALWNSGHGLDTRKLADLLWDEGATQQQIGQVFKYFNWDLETLADAMDDGVTKSDGTKLNYTDVAIALWNSGYSFTYRKLADLLWDEGATQQQVGQAFKYLGLSLEDIADSVKWGITKADGTNANYTDAALAIWDSDYGFTYRKLADLLWDEGAGQQQVGQAFKYLGLSLEDIADSVKWGITQSNGSNLNFTDVALALWNSGHSIDSRKLADLLWDEGATLGEVGQAMKYLGFSLENIADAMDDGVTNSNGTGLSYSQVAKAIWDSGYSFTYRKLADLLWDEGAGQGDIGKAFKYLGLSLEDIADSVKWGVTKSDGSNLNYNSVALAIWDSGYGFTYRKLADLLWDEGAGQQQVGQAFKYLGLSLEDIADSVKWGITQSNGSNLNFTDVALALWNSGHSIDSRKLADLLWDEGATLGEVGQAMKYLGFSLENIADAMDDGVTNSNGTGLSYSQVAKAIWDSGYSFTYRKLADLLWDEGAGQGDIGKAFKYLGLSLETIADSVKWGVTKSNGTNLNFIDVALAIWNSGYGFTYRKLADLLWDEGAAQEEIGKAFRYLGLSLEDIADSVKWGVTKSDGTNLNYNSVAEALWYSGYGFTYRKFADLLWDESASQQDIGKAFRYLGLSLEDIADAVKWGVTKSDGTNLNYNIVAEALWYSGHSIDSRKLADLLWNENASQSLMGQAMRYLGFNNWTIGDAVKRGAGLNYISTTIAIKNSGNGWSSEGVADILYNLGAGFNDVYWAMRELGNNDFWSTTIAGYKWVVKTITNFFSDFQNTSVFSGITTTYNTFTSIGDTLGDLYNKGSDAVGGVIDKGKEVYQDNKTVVDLVLLPYTLPNSIVVNTVEAALKGDVEVIVDGLKKIPVLGTAVGVIDGVIKAAQGDEKGVLEESINSALAFYGASNAITPTMVEFAIDIFWELKDLDYQGAISASLENLGMQKTVADLFVTVAWSMAVDNNWETAINAALTKVGFNNANSFVNMAWDIIDGNYKEALQTGLQLVGFTNLGIDQAKADAFLNLTVAIRDGNPNQAADILIALSGNDPQVIQSNWIKDLKDGNLANDRQAIQLGLSNLGFKDVTQWVDSIWAVKEGKYLDALSAVLTLGSFADTQDWVKIIGNLQKENYGEALSTAFKLADFPDGQSLADAVLAVKKGDYITAFYESLNLIEGGRDLADAFKYLIEFDLQEFVTSMIGAAPLLLKVLI